MTTKWNNITEGAEIEPYTYGPISQTDIVRYQGASGDFQPVHHDTDYAREAGLDGPIVIGMLPAAILTINPTRQFGAENCRKTGIRWRGSLVPGDTLTFHGSVTKKYQEGAENRIDITLSGMNQNNQEVIQGWMTFVVPV